MRTRLCRSQQSKCMAHRISAKLQGRVRFGTASASRPNGGLPKRTPPYAPRCRQSAARCAHPALCCSASRPAPDPPPQAGPPPAPFPAGCAHRRVRAAPSQLSRANASARDGWCSRYSANRASSRRCTVSPRKPARLETRGQVGDVPSQRRIAGGLFGQCEAQQQRVDSRAPAEQCDRPRQGGRDPAASPTMRRADRGRSGRAPSRARTSFRRMDRPTGRPSLRPA